MKLLYKASIIILFGCYSISSIANNTQMPLTTKNTDNIRYHKNRYHSYEQINAIMGKNFNEARAMLQQNFDFAKESVNENLKLAKYSIEQSLNFAQAALHNNNVTNNDGLLKSSLELSNNVTNKTLEAIMANIDKSLATTQTGISESFKATNVATRKSLDTYATTTFHNGVIIMNPTVSENTHIKPNSHNSGSAAHNSNSNIENHEETLAHFTRDYP